ncbi:hypothetical protein NITHO_4790007 [Nitrolancea hollandica Lb]|uniref:Uncharacterized protein n=1 Tax=Nitrolancea hollandica Lb TaxID=1129897 RepID=I4EKS9_9BACT|nr:hypothetical protein NITHO_4790007 [Nitrolancea hollandica Lb]
MARSYLTHVAGAAFHRRYGGHVAPATRGETIAGLSRNPSPTGPDGPIPRRLVAERYRTPGAGEGPDAHYRKNHETRQY